MAATSLIVWTTAADGTIVEDSPSWRETTGQTLEEFLGWGWLDALHPDDREPAARAWQVAVDRLAQFDHPYRLLRADGRYRLVRSRGVPIIEDGVLREWVGTCTDITEAAEAEAAREELVRQARRAADRTLRLQRATSALSRALTRSDVGRVVLEHGSAELGATGCGMALLDEGAQVLRMVVMHGYPDDVVQEWQTSDVTRSTYLTDALTSGEPVFVSTPEELARRYDSPRLHSAVRRTGNRSWCALPLTTTGGPAGVLSFGFPREREFSEDERTFLVALAAQCAQALARAELYERQASTALLLQQSLLPAKLPTVPGLTVAAHYRPATEDVEVGGDWFDLLALPDGRSAVVLGDVMGKGVPAATVMGQVRNAVRAYAVLDPDPEQVVTWLDRLFEGFELEQITTLVYGVHDPRTGQLTWVNAGHLPALVVGAGGTRLLDDDPGTPLGVGGRRRAQVTTLEPGDHLLLFSDGLVERRGESLTEGLARLADVLAELVAGHPPCDLDAVVQETFRRLLPDASHTDDVTMLLMRAGGASR